MGKAGRLFESVAFDQPSGSTDAFGGTTAAWTEVHTCRAEFLYERTRNSDEKVMAARHAGRQIYKVRVRACDETRAITPEYRMRDVRRSVEYNIFDIDTITDRANVWIQVEGPVVR